MPRKLPEEVYKDYLREAEAPATLPERLQAIFEQVKSKRQSSEKETLISAIAVHPNIPPDILAEAFLRAPQAALRNPTLPLLPLSNPNFGLSLTCEAAAEALRSPECPASFVAMLIAIPPEWENYYRPSPESIVQEARMHIALAGEIPAEDWLTSVRSFWLESVSTLAGEAQAALAELSDYGLFPTDLVPTEPDPFAAEDATLIQTALAVPTGDLRTLVDRACNPASPREWLCRYATDSRWWVHLAVATNPATPPEALVQLAQQFQTEPAFRRALVRHPRTDSAVLDTLLEGKDYHAPLDHPPAKPSVRRLIVRHAAATPAVKLKAQKAMLAGIGVDETDLFRFAHLHAKGNVAQDRYYAASIKNNTLRSLDLFKRLIAAALLPPSLQQDLAQDSNRLVRAAAQARLRGEVFTWEDDV